MMWHNHAGDVMIVGEVVVVGDEVEEPVVIILEEVVMVGDVLLM